MGCQFYHSSKKSEIGHQLFWDNRTTIPMTVSKLPHKKSCNRVSNVMKIQVQHFWDNPQRNIAMRDNHGKGSYWFRGPLDQTIRSSVSFTIETNEITLTEWTILIRRTTQINCKRHGSWMVCFQW